MAVNEQHRRIGAFLAQYVNPIYADQSLDDPAVQKYSIGLLISEGVMTAEEIRREAVKDYDVIIPFDMFPKEADV